MLSLYERLGGEGAIQQVADRFYRRVLQDDRISSFFVDLDLAAQSNKQKAFLGMLFGGPYSYSGKCMRESHAHLKLLDGHFNAMVELLVETMVELGLDDEAIADATGAAERIRHEVLNQ